MTPARLYLLQRLSAMVLAPLVLLHLAVIVYAVQDGLGAAEILARTRGNLAWTTLYGVFVLAAAVHGAIGLRSVAGEVLGWSKGRLDGLMYAFALLLVVLGWRAVAAVTL
jgi:fumarate reductase subunit C